LKLGVNAVIVNAVPIALNYIILFGLSRVVGTLLQEYRLVLLNRVSSNVIVEFSKDMMNYLMRMEYSVFKNNSERVLNTFNKSLQGIDRLNRWIIGNVMSNVIEIGIVAGMLYFLCGPKYFVNTICIYAIYMFATRKISNYRNKIIRDKYEAEIVSENKLFNIIYNISTIKYFQREESETDKFASGVRDVREKDQHVTRSLAVLNSTQSFIISIGMVLNLYMGVLDCAAGVLTPGDLVMLQAIFAQIMMPLNFMGTLMREVDETKVNLKYAVDMILEKEKVKNIKKELMPFNFNGGKLEFNNVSFAFPGSPKNILNDLNLIFEKNSFNAIVGHSGGGKSTIFNLIYKLYEPTSGHITIDNQDISKVDEAEIRKVKT
jgi:ABC-type transport system involved in Fe-S cluster assembly fused permease/ATPase subunit